MLPPVGVKAIVLSATTIVLTWTDTSLGRNQHVTDNRHYVIRYNPKLSRKPKVVNATDLNLYLEDLKPDTEYEFSIKVIKGQRQSTWSLSVFNKTRESGRHSPLATSYVRLISDDRGLGGVVGLTLPMSRADHGSRPVYYLPCSHLVQVVNLSLSVA